MLDKSGFMEALQSLADYAELNGGVLTKTEVEENFQGMELTEGQYDLIYQYLFEKRITITGIEMKLPTRELKASEYRNSGGVQEPELTWAAPAFSNDEEEYDKGEKYDKVHGIAADWEKEENGQKCSSSDFEELTSKTDSGTEEPKSREDSVYLQMYLEELKDLPKLTEPERLQLVMQLMDGRAEVLSELLNASLYQVVDIARDYCGRGALLEDLIQEGNIGLMQVLEELKGKRQQVEPLLYMKEFIQYTIEQYLDSELAEGEDEEQVLAKMALLHEAARLMATENGVLPTAKELAAYTKIPEAEIMDMVSLTKDVSLIQD